MINVGIIGCGFVGGALEAAGKREERELAHYPERELAR